MTKYHKINTIYKRDPETNKLRFGDWSSEYYSELAELDWIWTEKLDGTNIRIIFDPNEDPLVSVQFRGRTDKAQIPSELLEYLKSEFTEEKLGSVLDGKFVLYGEGIGRKIQKVGSKYRPNGVDFVLFDVAYLGNRGLKWLSFDTVQDIGACLGCPVTQIINVGPLFWAENLVREGFNSRFSAEPLLAEGLVVRPPVDLFDSKGNRIIAKIKTCDFNV